VKNVLVTGGAGFIGSFLSEALLARGDEVLVVDDLSTGNSQNLENVRNHPRLRFVQGDQSDSQLVREVLADVNEVYHLAAAVGVALVARQPIETIKRNIVPTDWLLSELLRRHQSGQQVKFFLASTSEVYGKNPKPVWSEDDDIVLGPTTFSRWSYGASKAIDEFMALGYWREYDLPIVVGRFFNVIGPRQSGAYGMVLPRFIEAARSGGLLIVHDDGQQTRCFAPVQEVVKAIIALMETSTAVGKIFNIGSDQPITIEALAQRVIALVNSAATIEHQSYAAAYDEDFEDVRHRVPDLTRLRQTIEYPSRFELDQIIQEISQP
jgi:UDP-glucose 4-epimerase